MPRPVDPWDSTTWKDLRVLRTELRDALFDCTDQQDEDRLHRELHRVEESILRGDTVDIPF